MSDTIDNNQAGSTDVPVEPADPGQPEQTFVQSFSRANIVRLLKAVLASVSTGADTADLEAKMDLLFPPTPLSPPEEPDDYSEYLNLETDFAMVPSSIDINETQSDTLMHESCLGFYFESRYGGNWTWQWKETESGDCKTAISCYNVSDANGRIYIAHIRKNNSSKIEMENFPYDDSGAEPEPTIIQRMKNVENSTQDHQTDLSDLEAKSALLFPRGYTEPDAPNPNDAASSQGYYNVGTISYGAYAQFTSEGGALTSETLASIMSTACEGMHFYHSDSGDINIYYKWTDTVADDLRTAVSCNGSSMEHGKVTLAHVIGGDNPRVEFEVIQDDPTILKRMASVESSSESNKTDVSSLKSWKYYRDIWEEQMKTWKTEMETWKTEIEKRVTALEPGNADDTQVGS